MQLVEESCGPTRKNSLKETPLSSLEGGGGCFSENLASPFPLPTMHYHPPRRYENRFLSTKGIKSDNLDIEATVVN